jgi:c-di-GMP-binding flagellar brake protein YcgR
VNEHNETIAKSADAVYRRRYVRVAVHAAITYTVDGQSEARTAQARDLGGGGIRIATDEDLPLGSVLLLRFPLPEAEREVMVRGRIVLSFYNAEDKRYLHGVAFTQIDPRDQEEIIKYVATEVQRLAVAEDQEEVPGSAAE